METDFWSDHPLLDARRFSGGSGTRMPERGEQHVRRHTTSWQRVFAREDARLPEDACAPYNMAEPGGLFG